MSTFDNRKLFMQISTEVSASKINLTQVEGITNRAFSKLDPANKGSFNKASFEKMLSQFSGGNPATTAIADKIFQKLDSNGSGQIDKSEFTNGVGSLMDKIQQGSGLQASFGGGAIGGLQALTGASTTAQNSSGDKSGKTDPIDMFLQALDSDKQEKSKTQSTQDYLKSIQNNMA